MKGRFFISSDLTKRRKAILSSIQRLYNEVWKVCTGININQTLTFRMHVIDTKNP